MRYMLQIEAECKEKALEIARGIAGFTLDENYGAAKVKNTFVVRGDSEQKLEAVPGVKVFGDGSKAELMEPQPELTQDDTNRPNYAPIDGRVRNIGGSNRIRRLKGCP